MNKELRLTPAFTLIELLVVIAVIGLISTISVLAMNEARSRARDSRRIQDMHQLATAIGVYYDRYGAYPSIADGARDNSADGNFITDLINAGIISASFRDPWNDRGLYLYYYDGPGNGAFTTRCPGGKVLLLFFLEHDTPLPGFAINSGNQDTANGYGRHICFY